MLGERIVAVGSAAEVDAWHGPQTKVLDAQGKLLLPGFNDAHVHFVDGGDHLSAVQLKDAASPEEFASKIADRVKITRQRRVDCRRRLGRTEMVAAQSSHQRAD